MKKDFMNAVEFSHFLLKENVEEEELVVDATAGNGHDTKFLAELVKEGGAVYAFDIQDDAINNTAQLLNKNNLRKQCRLIKDNHANLGQYIDKKISAVIFNLGYLPGGDKKIITRSKNTTAALDQAVKLLKKKGIIILVIYSGHEGGKEEKEAVLKYTSELNHKKFNVLNYRFLNQVGSPPEIVAVKKRK